MLIHLRSTDEIVPAAIERARVWRGHDDRGQPLLALVAAVALRDNQDRHEAERDLEEIPPPAIIPRDVARRLAGPLPDAVGGVVFYGDVVYIAGRALTEDEVAGLTARLLCHVLSCRGL